MKPRSVIIYAHSMVMNMTIYCHAKESLPQLKSVTVKNMQPSNKWKVYALFYDFHTGACVLWI